MVDTDSGENCSCIEIMQTPNPSYWFQEGFFQRSSKCRSSSCSSIVEFRWNMFSYNFKIGTESSDDHMILAFEVLMISSFEVLTIPSLEVLTIPCLKVLMILLWSSEDSCFKVQGIFAFKVLMIPALKLWWSMVWGSGDSGFRSSDNPCFVQLNKLILISLSRELQVFSL